MATTTNYGWTTPDDTALVKDGAAAIRTLGSSVDTTTKALNPSTTLGDIEYRSSTSNTNTRLGIGTSGQALTVVAGAPSWAASSTSVLTTTGDSLYASSANTLARLGIGSTGQVLTVAGGVPSWATPASGSITLLITTNITATTTITVSSISSSYTSLEILIENFKASGDNSAVTIRLNGDTGNNYSWNIRQNTSGATAGVSSIDAPGSMGLDNVNDNSVYVVDIPFYTSTSAYKTGSIITGWQQNDGYWYSANGNFGYKSTSAISSFSWICSTNWAAQGTIKVYGVK